MTEKKQLGRILLKQKAISPDQLDKALAQPGGRLASRLTESGSVSGLAALKALSEQHGIPGIDLDQVCVRLSDLELLPREIAERHLILPVLSRGERLFVAMANPKEKKVIDELEFVTGKRVFPYVALENPLAETIEKAYERKARGEEFYLGDKCPNETLDKLGIRREDSRGVSSSVGDSSSAEDAFSGGAVGSVPMNEKKPSLSTAPVSQAVDSLEQPRPPLADVGASSAPLDSLPSTEAQESAPEVEYEDFGDLNSELSLVTDLPEELTTDSDQSVATILVVDDEAEIRRLLEKLLSGKGHRVLLAENGQMALKMVKEHQPDLLVLDAMLPEVHGFD
ncbi:MAG: response regulator, partial [Polyangiaceae bacterium]|nr:response regulator [Polyangiaceae bacterium]